MGSYHVKPGSPGDILEHHGVKGMKWGVRKAETGGKAANAKNVEKLFSNPTVAGARISDLKGKVAPRPSAPPNQRTVRDVEAEQKQALRKAEAANGGKKLSDAQKKAIVGAVAISALIGANALARGQQSGALNSWKLQAQQRLHGGKVPFKINKDLAKPMDAEGILNNVAKQVNPNYSQMGGKMNCRRCTYVYELRRRGFDVNATTSAVGWGQSESGVINAVTPGGKKFYDSLSVSQAVVSTGKSSVALGDKRTNPVKKILMENLMTDNILKSPTISSSKSVLDELAKQPNGARGEVLFKFSGFGHSMAYEVIDGKPHIFDSQKGTLYNSEHPVETKWDGFSGAEITRLDNVDLDLKFLTRWADNN